MRIILHNIHEYVWYKYPYNANKIKIGVQKYDYILDWLLANNKKVFVLVDDRHKKNKIKCILNLRILIHFFQWCTYNKLDFFKFKLLFNPLKLKKTDYLFLFHYNYFTFIDKETIEIRQKLNELIYKSNSQKIVHLTHYSYNIQFGSDNLKKLNPSLLVAENNLLKNAPFFQKYFAWFKNEFYTIPFIPKNRFINNTPFLERINKAVVFGTITYPMLEKEFVEYFNTNLLQPFRSILYDNKEKFTKYYDSYITKIDDQNNNPSIIKNTTTPINIVTQFNQYKMFIVPEEIIGLPGVSFVEGMACGTAFIGIEDNMYKDLGMIPNKHYITYNGKIEDLIEKIYYYQNNPAILATIAENGYLFVKENFNIDKVMSDFLKKLQLK